MNRKAQITLDNVYPRRIGTNTLIKDIDELLQMNFAEKLRKVTVKKDAKFVDYRPETGSWVFKVDHFSRYGYSDSDEEADAANQEAAAKKTLEGKQKLEAKRDSKIPGKEPASLDPVKNTDPAKETSQVRITLYFFERIVIGISVWKILTVSNPGTSRRN